MTQHDDATQPRRDKVIPQGTDLEALAQEHQAQSDVPYDAYDDNENTGPGCLAWGIMGVFAILLAIATVITAIFAGFNQGLNTAQVTAAAATDQNIARQCQILPTDIAVGRLDVVASRFEALTINGTLAQCASVFAPQATTVYQQSLITPTEPATATPVPTLEPTQDIVQATEASSQSDSPYDLNGLLAEARTSISQQNYDDAVETLDAIRAIDPNFETTTVTGLLFNALTQQATNEFRSPNGSLARGILLTNRSEQFGDITLLDISFERSVAESYLDAQANLGLNYQLAITLLNQVIGLSPNYPRGTGEAANQLVEQYEAYGDALLAGADACTARVQFDAALSFRPNNINLQTKVNTAQEQCTFGVPATLDPNATVDPNATLSPAPAITATPTVGVAPVGSTGD